MNGWLPSIRAEQAMFVLVLLGSVFIALGFVSTSIYHYRHGFSTGVVSTRVGAVGTYGLPVRHSGDIPRCSDPAHWIVWMESREESLVPKDHC